ncbi:MAG: ferredoxin [Actinomycetota bacterium]
MEASRPERRRLRVDEDLCAASGVCESICPEVFEVAEVARVRAQPEEHLLDRVREAVESCPTEAIVFEAE